MAGRSPQHFIDDLLDRTDLVEVIDNRVKLRKTGRNYSALCPFHDEKTPSFSVNPEKQFYYCFGCGAGGNAIGFLMEHDSLDFPAAVEQLASRIGVEIPRENNHFVERDSQKRELYDLMEKTARLYQDHLRQHPQAQQAVNYLKQRGLTGQIAQRFGIGFAPPGWDNVLSTFGQDDKSRQQLIDIGLLVEREDKQRLYDRFRHRIMFPIRDNRGRVIAFGGRVLGDDKPKYLNSPETSIFQKNRELYGLYEARKNNRKLENLIVVEGYMDVVALNQFGVTNAVATLGTASNEHHLRQLFRYAPEVIFCFDGDEAGRKAAERAMDNALPTMEDGRQIRFLFLPEGEDPDTLIRSQGVEGFNRHVALAAPLSDYLYATLSKGLDINTMDGRARLASLTAPKLQKLQPGIFRQLMYEELARRTGLGRETLEKLLAAPPEPTPSAAPRPRKARPSRASTSGWPSPSCATAPRSSSSATSASRPSRSCSSWNTPTG